MLRGSIPPTGLPLPFISAGSTLLLVFMSAIGLYSMWIGRVEKVKSKIVSICKCFLMNFSIDIKKRLCYMFNILI